MPIVKGGVGWAKGQEVRVLLFLPLKRGGDRGRESGKKGQEVYWRREKRGGGSRIIDKGGRKQEKKGKITQHCAIFRNRINAKGGGAKKIQGGNRD